MIFGDQVALIFFGNLFGCQAPDEQSEQGNRQNEQSVSVNSAGLLHHLLR